MTAGISRLRPPSGMKGRSRLAAEAVAGYDRALRELRRISLPALRLALGSVYIWFGVLKLAGVSPVTRLVENTVPFVDPPEWFVPAVGAFEILIGGWLITGLALRLLLPLFVAHMLGTFGVLVLQPGVAFQHGDPLLLTSTGEFVVKNLVLLAAGIAVATRTPAPGATLSGRRSG